MLQDFDAVKGKQGLLNKKIKSSNCLNSPHNVCFPLPCVLFFGYCSCFKSDLDVVKSKVGTFNQYINSSYDVEVLNFSKTPKTVLLISQQPNIAQR